MRAVVRNHGLSALPISDKIAMHIRAFMRFPQSAWIIPRLFHFFLTCLACSEKKSVFKPQKSEDKVRTFLVFKAGRANIDAKTTSNRFCTT
jgi:hypothetical protein